MFVTLPANCVIKGNGILNLNFGTFDTSESKTPKYTNNVFNISCTKGTNAHIAIDQGSYSAYATNTSRAMFNGETGYLSYDIYSSPSDAAVWDNRNIVPYTAVSTSPRSLIVYVRIPPNQIAEAGVYKDSVNISVCFYPHTNIVNVRSLITVAFLPA